MNTLQPKLRFPYFKGNWNIKKLGQISSKVNSGKTPLGGESVYTDSGILFIRSQNVLDSKLCFENSTFIDERTNNSMKNSTVLSNDILLNITGASLGRSCVVPKDFIIGNVNQHVCIIRLNAGNNSNFIQSILASDKGQTKLKNLSTGSGREGLNFQSIKNLEVYIPSIQEQTKIANFLSSIDEKINLLKEKKSLLEEYKKGIMQKIFNQEIRFKDDNGNDFADWEVKTLGEIGTFQTSSIDKISRDDEEEVFLVNYLNVYKHENINNYTKQHLQIVTAKNSQITSCNLKKGDILFTPSSETPDDIGQSVVIFEDLNNCVYSYHLMRFRPNIEIDILYSHYFCNNTKVLGQISRLATGSTRFTISVKSFSSIIIDLPCLKEQSKIANFLTAIDEKIELVSNQIQDTQEYKKGLLQQMFV